MGKSGKAAGRQPKSEYTGSVSSADPYRADIPATVIPRSGLDKKVRLSGCEGILDQSESGNLYIGAELAEDPYIGVRQ